MPPTEFVHVGYGGTIAVNRVLAIAAPDSAPIKRMVRLASKENRIINLTYGRKAKCVIVLDSGHIVLAAFQPNNILRRISDYRSRGVLRQVSPQEGALTRDASLPDAQDVALLDLTLDSERSETTDEENSE